MVEGAYYESTRCLVIVMVRCCNHQEFRRVLAASVNRRLFESGKKSPPPPFPPLPPPPPRLRLGRDRPTAEATRRSCVGRQGSGLHSLRGLIFVLLSGPACSGHAGLPVPTRCKSTGESRVVAARPTRRACAGAPTRIAPSVKPLPINVKSRPGSRSPRQRATAEAGGGRACRVGAFV